MVGPVIITELSNSARPRCRPVRAKSHLRQPLEVLAVLLAVGFVLTILVRPVEAAASK